MRNLFGSRKSAGLRLSWVTPDIAISRAPHDPEWSDMQANGLRSVLDLREPGFDSSHLADASQVEYLHLPIDEYQAPSLPLLIEAADWVNSHVDAFGPVLVHCREGRGRSPMVACAALIRRGLPLLPAFRLVQRARPEVSLSVSQMKLLEELASLGQSAGPEVQDATG